jgi:hypothetical protein
VAVAAADLDAPVREESALLVLIPIVYLSFLTTDLQNSTYCEALEAAERAARPSAT